MSAVQKKQNEESAIPLEQLDAALRSLYGLSEARAAEIDQSPRRTLRDGDISWGRVLASNLDRLDSWVEWRALRNDRIMPALERLQTTCRGVDSVKEWVQVGKSVGYHSIFMSG